MLPVIHIFEKFITVNNRSLSKYLNYVSLGSMRGIVLYYNRKVLGGLWGIYMWLEQRTDHLGLKHCQLAANK
jgi:hypothetical protein